jgi:hypothetical protein
VSYDLFEETVSLPILGIYFAFFGVGLCLHSMVFGWVVICLFLFNFGKYSKWLSNVSAKYIVKHTNSPSTKVTSHLESRLFAFMGHSVHSHRAQQGNSLRLTIAAFQ